MEEHFEAQDDVALEILIEAGVLTRCPIHEESILAGGADIEDAYKLANHHYTNNTEEWGLPDLFQDRREMTDTILKVYKFQGGGADGCGWCMKD